MKTNKLIVFLFALPLIALGQVQNIQVSPANLDLLTPSTGFNLKNAQTLLGKSGSTVQMASGSTLIAKSGSTFTVESGVSTNFFGDVSFSTQLTVPKIVYSGSVVEVFGTGSPNGAVSAAVGSVYHRTDGASGTTLYIKESGSGNTGWTAVSSGGGGGTGDVVGPASATANGIVRYNSTTGKLVKDSTVTISDAGVMYLSTTASGGITIDNTSTQPPYLLYNLSGTAQALLGVAHASGDINDSSVVSDFCFRLVQSGKSFKWSVDNGTTDHMRLNSSGLNLAVPLSTSGAISTTSTTASTSTTTGSGIFAGGVGIAGGLNVGTSSKFLGTSLAEGESFTPTAWGTGGAVDINGSGGGLIALYYAGAPKGYFLALSGGGMSFNTQGTGSLLFNINGTATMSVTGATAIRFNGYGAGTLTTDASGNITASSDERLKDIQGNYTAGLAELRGIQPITYKWKPSTGLDQAEAYSGFSAQNVLTNLPDAVDMGMDGKYTLQDRAILAALVNAVNQLRAQNELLTALVKDLANAPADKARAQAVLTVLQTVDTTDKAARAAAKDAALQQRTATRLAAQQVAAQVQKN